MCISGSLWGSFVLPSLCVYFSLLSVFLSNQNWKCSGRLVASDSQRLPSFSQGCRRRMLRSATASPVFVLLGCSFARWSVFALRCCNNWNHSLCDKGNTLWLYLEMLWLVGVMYRFLWGLTCRCWSLIAAGSLIEVLILNPIENEGITRFYDFLHDTTCFWALFNFQL